MNTYSPSEYMSLSELPLFYSLKEKGGQARLTYIWKHGECGLGELRFWRMHSCSRMLCFLSHPHATSAILILAIKSCDKIFIPLMIIFQQTFYHLLYFQNIKSMNIISKAESFWIMCYMLCITDSFSGPRRLYGTKTLLCGCNWWIWLSFISRKVKQENYDDIWIMQSRFLTQRKGMIELGLIDFVPSKITFKNRRYTTRKVRLGFSEWTAVWKNKWSNQRRGNRRFVNVTGVVVKVLCSCLSKCVQMH